VPHYTYLIIGGGMTADAAVRGIRQVDPGGSIALIGAEPDPPYKRPHLSKELWRGKPLEKLWCRTESQGVELYLGRTAKVLESQNKKVIDDRGAVYTFDRLLLAIGGMPRRFPFDTAENQIIYFRTLEDYRRLSEKGNRFAVIGGGFIGSEIAAALAMNGKEVVMVLRREGIGAHMFPHDLAMFLSDFYRQKGVEVLTGETPISVERRGEQLALVTQGIRISSKREILVDGIVAGLGIQPNVELAQAAGLGGG
jgi:NADPH-dependent 2,4-dienoyl-CoA reductase/sulfur reductase-like enzyme